jgi:GGDEF domain-containing protein
VPDARPAETALPRARAVPSLPVDGLIARSQEIARSWAVALVSELPLPRIGEVPLQEIASGAPALCAQALRALTAEADLARLTGEGGASVRGGHVPALDLMRISGSRDAAGVVRAAEALRGVLWEALLDEVHRASARELGEAADRLAYVCASTLAAALAAAPAEPAPPGPQRPAGAAAPSRPVSRALIVDEMEIEPAEPVAVTAAPAAPSSAEDGPQIEIRDQRTRPGPSVWIDTIGRRLEFFRQDGRPFSVLLVEPVELELLREMQAEDPAGGLAHRIEQALAAELPYGPGAGPDTAVSLTCEAPGRWWVLTPAPDRAGADGVAESLARAASAVIDGRGQPVQIAVGTALCPVDGREPAALAAHADIGLYAARAGARAAGRRMAAQADDYS